MNNNKIPDWLVNVQNKSWEPEILISGITLTFVFIFSNYIYNFFGMLVQDYAVFTGIAKTLYRISLIAITGLKIILIFHLVLRGLWTGVVGLSYVFPNGINENNLSKSQKHIIYDKPDTLVIKLEKICSLLFSFVFSSIWIGIAIFIYFSPLLILFIAGLDLYYISIISLAYALLTFVIIIIFSLFLKTKFENTKIEERLANTIFSNILTTYMTNIGKIKTSLIFIVFFIIVIFISRTDILNFGFNNKEEIKPEFSVVNITVNNDHYENTRIPELRFPKAIVDQFSVSGNEIKLSISLYKEDLYFIEEIENDSVLCKESGIKTESQKKISLLDLYKIIIDDKAISALRWYSTKNIYTNQNLIVTTIPLDTLGTGYHELKINKTYFEVLKQQVKLINNWDIIPFEIVRLKE